MTNINTQETDYSVYLKSRKLLTCLYYYCIKLI